MMDRVRVRAFRLDGALARVPLEPTEGPEDGARRIEAHDDRAVAVEFVLPCRPDEHFAGFGESFVHVDKRGRIVEGRVGSSVQQVVPFSQALDGGYCVAPLFYSSAGYAAWSDTTRFWSIDLGVTRPDEVRIRIPGTAARLWVAEGDLEETIPLVTDRTGRSPVPAHWAFGVWKAIRGGQEAALEEARRLRDRGVPAGAIWLDAYWDGETNSGFPAAGSYELGSYPDLAETVGELHELGFKVLGYVNPFLYKRTPAHDEAVERGFLVGGSDGRPVYLTRIHPLEGDELGVAEPVGIHSLADGNSVVDLTNPEARRWWQGLLRRILTEQGFDGWMEDFGEGFPEDGVLWDGTTPAEGFNRYPLLYHEAAREEVLRTKPDAVTFSRSGYLGSQRHVPVYWPGDQTRDWSSEAGIASVPAAGISIGLMGVGTWGPDIAGIVGFADAAPYGRGPADEELYLRWVQLGAMTPVMREHLGFHVPAPVDSWTNDETVETWRRCGRWHTALFPYLYSLAHEAHDTGLPILRGLMIHHPAHPEAWTINDTYLLGDALLCAPVLEKGRETRRVWLPPGGWVDPWTGDHHGGGWTDIAAPLDRWPHLQRAGSVVPMLADVPLDLNDGRYARGEFDLELRAASGPRSERVLFDGTGITLDGDELRIESPFERRCFAATPGGDRTDEGVGADVTIRLGAGGG